MRVVKTMEPGHWTFQEPASCTLSGMFQLDLTQPHNRRGGLELQLSNSGLWIHKGLLTTPGEMNARVTQGLVLLLAKVMGVASEKRIGSYDYGAFVLRFLSDIHL